MQKANNLIKLSKFLEMTNLAFSSDLMQKLTSDFPFENCFDLSRQGGRQIVD